MAVVVLEHWPSDSHRRLTRELVFTREQGGWQLLVTDRDSRYLTHTRKLLRNRQGGKEFVYRIRKIDTDRWGLFACYKGA